MNIKGKLILATLCALPLPGTVLGVPVLDASIEVAQPDDGSPGRFRFKIHPKGDEWSNWDETDDGYSVVREKATGKWHYAQKNANGKLEASPAEVGRDNPAARGLRKRVRPSRTPDQAAQAAAAAESAAPVSAIDQAAIAPTTGQVPTLFILVRFLNTSNTYTADDFAGFQANQLRAYFNEASYGNLQTTPAVEGHGAAGDGIIGWLALNQNHPDTRGSTDDRNRQLTAAAIVAADPYIDYGSYDTNRDGYVDPKELAVVVIPAGYETAYGGPSGAGTPSVWGHKWSLGWGAVAAPVVDGVYVGHYHNGQGGYAQFGEIHGYGTSSSNHQATLGIMAHELGHLVMGWPDLYDTDQSSAGLGNWSLMAGGSWAYKPGDGYQGQTPVHPDAWSKLYAGWVTPVSATLGEFTLPAAGSMSATSLNAVQIQTTSDPKQYFLFENRGQSGFDRGLYMIGTGTGGIAVYHIDENMAGNANESHKMVDLEEADNDTGMDTNASRGKPTNLFYYGNKTVFDSASLPASMLYNGMATGISLNAVSTSNEQMTANFGAPQVNYSLSVSRAGSGTVTTSPAGINCGTTCTATYASGTTLTLFATAASGNVFSGWGGACSGTSTTCTVSMSSSRTVTANFSQLATDTDGDGIGDESDNCTLVANPTQIDSDGDAYGNQCDGDLNNNGFTNAQDYMLFQAQLGRPSVAPTYNPADLNGNGFVNAQDAVIFRSLIGSQSGPSGTAP